MNFAIFLTCHLQVTFSYFCAPAFHQILPGDATASNTKVRALH